ncbi:outer membrane protein transport protein [Coraliomargarita algicola]|uniref:Outer membrane protein transport protein n=1 Tax=Coraliomargarita algicola TaxID=3092156 RepID=A0ABZ0RK84_9BACT|nr:outer membrane protein transport protein [Coraliomargarita sp. J2-16]WPJ95513.1 outer membrane protein transport protein [Coraliomargarita sp. J2-16]
MKKLQHPLIPIGLSLLACGSIEAAATRIAFVDAFATARGNAFTATADNPSAVFYNAAGLTQLEGTQIQGNVFAISLGYEYSGATGSDDMDDTYQPVPSAFISHTFKDAPFALGFGMYAPFALGTDWGGDDTRFQLAGQTVPYEADLQYIKYHAVIAWQISDSLSLAGGLSFDDTTVDIKTNALQFDGDDQTMGYSLSILWQPSVKHSFGLNYQAKTDVTYQGKASGPAITLLTGGATNRANTKADLVYPESIVFGYSYRPNEHWNLEFNLDWTNWDHVDELIMDIDGNLGPSPTYTLNWKSTFICELGFTRYLDNGWHVSGGYTFVENAVPDTYFLPIVPDTDRHFLAVGVGRSYDHISWQITYQQAFASERTVSGNQTSDTIDGGYDLDSQAVAVSFKYSF